MDRALPFRADLLHAGEDDRQLEAWAMLGSYDEDRWASEELGKLGEEPPLQVWPGASWTMATHAGTYEKANLRRTLFHLMMRSFCLRLLWWSPSFKLHPAMSEGFRKRKLLKY